MNKNKYYALSQIFIFVINGNTHFYFYAGHLSRNYLIIIVSGLSKTCLSPHSNSSLGYAFTHN